MNSRLPTRFTTISARALAAAAALALGLTLVPHAAFAEEAPTSSHSEESTAAPRTPDPTLEESTPDQDTPTIDAPAEAAPAEEAPAEDAPATRAADALTLALVRTDSDSDTARVGDTVTYTLRYTNNTGSKLTAFPRTSNLADTAVKEPKGHCRWADLGPGVTKECASPKITITAEMLKAGTFTAEVVVDATRDRAGKDVIQAGIRVTAPTLTLKEAGAPKPDDPSTVPTDRADGQPVVLARGGDAGFNCHRIPALTTATNGWILAAWDGRPNDCGDAPQANSIVQRISKDGGRSWEPLTVVAAGRPGYPKFGYSDPSYVVDRETGEIFLFFVKSFDVGLWQSQAGTDPDNRRVLHAAVMSSTDHGAHWSQPQVITPQITPADSWTARFAASGEGIQKRNAPHAGRLMQQYTVVVDGVFKAVTVYSDDHGRTWKSGEPFGAGMDENKIVELADGRVMDNSRASQYGAPGVKARRVTISEDGGQTWGETTVDHQLVDPNNNASIIRAYPDAPAGDPRAHMLLFSNTASASARENGTISLSLDDGASWTTTKPFHAGAMQYSTLTPLPDASGTFTSGRYGLLYEAPNKGLSYMTVSMDWIGVPEVKVGGVSRTVNRGGNYLTFEVANISDHEVAASTLTPTPLAGWTWSKESVEIPALAPGATHKVHVKAAISNQQDSGRVRVEATLRVPGAGGADARTYRGGMDVEVVLEPGQTNATCAAVTIADEATVPAETAGEDGRVSNLLDGDDATMWHTPWAGLPSPLPLSVDFLVADPTGVVSLETVPRASGDNGRITAADVSLVSVDGVLPLAADVDMSRKASVSLDSLAQKVPAGQGARIRLTVKSTAGDSPSQANKYVSLATTCFRTQGGGAITHDEADPAVPFAVTLPGGPIRPGDVLEARIVGATPKALIEATFHSTPVPVGSVEADAAGEATLRFTVPADAEVGAHRLVLVEPATGRSAEAAMTVSAPKPADPQDPQQSGDPSKPAQPKDPSGSTAAGKAGTVGKSGAARTSKDLAATGGDIAPMVVIAALGALAGAAGVVTKRRVRR
ncbi:exo-alpha-sialidase [Schaalia sp. 19OD2882]|uniref:sialidase family protein n=1 Tax=Schaalia sp. 19OD2882 TaxID=2794089 RepID=UPI001C1F0E9B|nr:sialidase family protein [Schaalia sp. 19OD2882]QWW19323.1 exo-alpha-sialidase [Schaalia sp. 19OD2882]